MTFSAPFGVPFGVPFGGTFGGNIWVDVSVDVTNVTKLTDDSDESLDTTEGNKNPRYGFGRVYHTKIFVCNKIEMVGIIILFTLILSLQISSF